jgi:hypothetical protein
MQCCCQQIGDNNPVDECGWSGNGIIYDHKKAPLRGDPGQHATGYGSGGERFDGWCQSLTIEEGGGTTGDNCCGGTGAPGGCYGGQISVY